MKTVHICMGLPGSGKTYFCKEKNTIDMDKISVSPVSGLPKPKKVIYSIVKDILSRDRKIQFMLMDCFSERSRSQNFLILCFL